MSHASSTPSPCYVRAFHHTVSDAAALLFAASSLRELQSSNLRRLGFESQEASLPLSTTASPDQVKSSQVNSPSAGPQEGTLPPLLCCLRESARFLVTRGRWGTHYPAARSAAASSRVARDLDGGRRARRGLSQAVPLSAAALVLGMSCCTRRDNTRAPKRPRCVGAHGYHLRMRRPRTGLSLTFGSLSARDLGRWSRCVARGPR